MLKKAQTSLRGLQLDYSVGEKLRVLGKRVSLEVNCSQRHQILQPSGSSQGVKHLLLLAWNQRPMSSPWAGCLSLAFPERQKKKKSQLEACTLHPDRINSEPDA